MPIVRTRFQPTVDLAVSNAEAAMLRAQGLLVDPEPESAATVAAAPPPAATKTPAASKASVPEQQAPASDDTKGE